MRKITLLAALLLLSLAAVAQISTTRSNMYDKQSFKPNHIHTWMMRKSLTAQANPSPLQKKVDFTTETISKTPEGVEKLYARSGEDYYELYGSNYNGLQNGYLLHLVIGLDGNTVYMKNPIAELGMGTWVKGCIEGNQLRFPLYQCIYYDTMGQYGFITAKLDYDSINRTYVPDFNAKDITFTVDPASGVISLDDITAPHTHLYGALNTNSMEWIGYGDFASVYTPFMEEIESTPQHLQKETWSFLYDNEGEADYDMVKVAIDGNKMYIDDFAMMPKNAAVVGTINEANGTVTFTSDQYIGILQDYDAIAYWAGANYTKEHHKVDDGMIQTEYDVYTYEYIPALTMQYDAENKTLMTAPNTAILFNCGKLAEQVHYIKPCTEVRIACYKEQSKQPANPAFKDYTDFTADYGSIKLELDIPFVDTDGDFIHPDHLSYQILTQRNGKEEVYVFDNAQYTSFDKTVDQIPYTFSDNYDILAGGETVYLYASTNFDDVAVQVINRAGGKEVRSDKVWYKAGPATGIRPIMTDTKATDRIVYHDLNGKKLSKPAKGLNLMTIFHKDGTHTTKKILVL